MKIILHVLYMLIPLVFSLYLDQTYAKVQQAATQSLQFATLFWLVVIGTVVLISTLFCLAWYALYINQRNIVISFVFIIFGTALLFSTTLLGYYNFWNKVLSSPHAQAWIINIVSTPLSFTACYAASIATIGTIRLIPNEHLWPKRRSELS